VNRPMLGYFLTGRNDRQEIYIFHGEGANGKSTLLSMVQHVLGAHFRTMVPESLFEGNSAKSGYDIASLRGARLAVAQEAESSMKLYGSLIKQIRGGDTLKARAIYKDPFEMVPTRKLVPVCNKRLTWTSMMKL